MNKDSYSDNEEVLKRLMEIIKDCEEIKRICTESKSYGELLSSIDILKKNINYSKY